MPHVPPPTRSPNQWCPLKAPGPLVSPLKLGWREEGGRDAEMEGWKGGLRVNLGHVLWSAPSSSENFSPFIENDRRDHRLIKSSFINCHLDQGSSVESWAKKDKSKTTKQTIWQVIASSETWKDKRNERKTLFEWDRFVIVIHLCYLKHNFDRNLYKDEQTLVSSLCPTFNELSLNEIS